MKRPTPLARRLVLALPILASIGLSAACSSSGSSLYEVAAEGDSRDRAETLIERGANVNEVNPSNSWTPLHVAAARGHPKMCETLLQNGADVNARDANGMTPLHLAMARGHDEVTGVLLAAGADASIKNDQGKTADDLGGN